MASKDDCEDFQSLLSAMQVLGFTMEEQDTIFRILAAVLHFGNVYFHRKPLKHGQEGVEVGSDAEIKWAGHLLQLSIDGIMRALTTKTTEARNERMFTPLNIDQALDARDAIAKALYSSLFSWLVSRVNTIVSKGPKQLSISILDIFGFEDFKENSFEQLCINYANESLQAHFNRYIFRIEQQEYIKEKIEWQTIGFTDNQPVISLICKKPVGILHLLDDESNFPKASDQSFLEKAHYNHALNEHYCRPRLNSPEFGIKHYAGLVWYSVDGFLDKNRDTLRIDVLDLLISSEISMISKMFQELKRNNEASKSANRSDGRFITMKPRTPTVSARFHDSLTTLLESMSKCNPWFVRCLKPNSDKIPMKFDMPVVLEQLRYTGMLETIRIRKTGYPVRMRYSHFAERFRCLVPVRIPKGAPSKEICRVVLDRDPRNRDHYQLGTSKVFMREPLQQKMEKERLVLQNAAAIKIQTAVRGHLARRRYKLMKNSAVKIQAEVRGFIARKRYKRLKRGIVKAQAKLRGTRQRKLYLEMKEELKKRKQVDQEQIQTKKFEELSMANARSRNPELSQDISIVLEELDEWHLVHSEKNIVKLVGQPPQVENCFELPPDIHEYPFQKFANMYFKTNALGPTQEPIQTPFLPKSKETDIQDSLALFKLILHFCNEVSNPKRELAISGYIVSKGLTNDKLRDEILCQLVSQSWKNSDERSSTQVWLLLSCCLSAFAPSPTLYKYLLKYVSDHGLNGYDVICQQKLLQAAKTAAPSGIARSYPPSMLEWRCNKKKVNMAVEAKFPDEMSSVSGLESWVTTEEVASLLVNSRGIEEDAGWTLSLTTPTNLYDINGAEFILDTISELEMPPGLPITKSQFLKSDRREQTSKKNMIIRPIEEKERRISAGSDRPNNNLRDLIQAENLQQQRSLSLGNLMENKDPINAAKVNVFGLSRSKLNERYLSSEKLTSARPKELIWSRAHKYSNEIPSSSESEVGTDAWSSRQPSVESSKSRSRQGALTTLDSPHINSHDGTGDSDFDMNSSPVAEIKEYKTRHGHPRYVKSQQMFRKSKGEKDYLRSSAHSDTSEATSLASHVRRVRVPSQSSDVDQFLDDLFLPVLDVNIDDLSDARSLATSIKGSRNDQRSGLLDSYLASVSAVELDSLCSPAKLAVSLKGGGRGEGRRKRDYDVPPSQPSHRGYASPAPVLLPNIPMPILTPTAPTPDLDRGKNTPGSPPFHAPSSAQNEGSFGYSRASTAFGYSGSDYLNPIPSQPMPFPYAAPFFGGDSRVNTPGTPLSPVTAFSMMPGYPFPPSVIPGMMSPTPGGFEMQNITAMQQNMQRLFLQSAVAQNMQIQQQLIAQNQALQQLLQQSAAAFTGTPEPSFPSQEQWSPERRLADVPRDRKSKEQVPPPVLPKSKSSCNLDSSVESIDRLIPRIEEKKERHEKSSSERSNVISVSALKSHLESKQHAVVKKEALENRPLAASSRRTSEVESIQPAKSGVPPPPPLPMEPLFSGDQPFLDQFGRAKTVRIGKWRWPPEKDDGDESAANFLEFKLQKQAQKKLASQRSIEEESANDFDIHFDSFEFKEEDVKTRPNKAGKEEERQEVKHSTPGSIGKLKLSGELRSKLEMVHSKKNSKQKQVEEEGSSKEDNSQGSVTKLSEHRKLLLEKQLYGGRWQSVEEIETITRIRSENKDETDRVRRVSADQMLNQRPRSSSSPPSSYYSPSSTPNLEARKVSESHMSRKFSSQSQLIDKSNFIDRDIKIHREKEAVRNNFENGEDTVDVERTKLHSPLQASFFTYNNVPWSMHVRKEVFSPTEALVSPLAIHLVFAQIVRDTEDPECLRLLKSDRMKMKQVLESYGVNSENVNDGNIRTSVKKNVVDLAKEFPLYFSRLYPVSGGRQSSDVQLLGVSHSGLRLVKRESMPEDRLALLDTIRFEDVIETSVPRASCLQIRLKSGVKLSLYSHRATLIRDLIERFAVEADTNSQTFVRALSDCNTKEPGVLSFRKGDLIRVANPADSYLEKGYLYGMLNGKAGIFPMEYVEFVDVESVHAYEMEKEASNWRGGESPTAESPQDSSSSPVSPDDGKHSLLQFALQHFRQNPSDRVGSGDELDKKKKSKKHKEPGADWTWKEQVDMVKFSKVPIAASLLCLDTTELNKLAIECFLAIMKYMGDLPMGKQQSEVDCVYTLLMNCHKHSPLRDEVYCQLMKQTTSNRSARQDSCQRGWRLLCIVAAYFDCSHTLQPYLLKYLESAAYDKRRAYHGTALVCLQNLRKTIRYGGRKNVPSIEEITALTAGRNAKRQIYQLPGGTERIINTKSTTVVQDIIEEICLELNIHSQEEMEEFSLYCIVEGDTFTMPLAREEYILDVTTELHKNEQIFYLIFCRSVWHHSLRLDSPLYVEVAFNQIAPDYLEGLLLVMPGEALSQDTVYDISKIAALLHRAPGLEHMPNMKETKFLLPKPALAVRDIKPPQWVSLVQSSWKEVDSVKPTQAKAQVLEILQKWPLFGSSFFAVKRVAEPGERAEHILALNKRGVHFLDVITHETLIHYPFSEVISTRKVKSEDGALFLDMKCGNLMQQRITRIQTDQAHEISRLIRQYINIEQRQQTEKPKK
ncbi:unconventional myosin-XV-like isoform X1 [Artemia franciscana]|uniref:unconventional myosin-XV-like isoform X1 n=1 Tax=Artemia franciscana TaxID=6661 RepID=UPI0032DAC4AB